MSHLDYVMRESQRAANATRLTHYVGIIDGFPVESMIPNVLFNLGASTVTALRPEAK